MTWKEEQLAKLPIKNGIRMRGEAMTRLEVFSDAAFAFALTMLVVSVGSIPSNLDELMEAMRRVPAFALCFAQISAFWVAHRMWSRRYGLEDWAATTLTLGMIFVVLIYVYPLRLIFSSFLAWLTGGWLPSEFDVSGPREIAMLFVIYGIGYSAMAIILALLNRRVLVRKKELGLNQVELIDAKKGFAIWTMQACTGLASALFSGAMPLEVGVYGGFVYFLQSFGYPVISIRYGKQLKALETKVEQ